MIRLITSFYYEGDCNRRAELVICLTENIKNSFIDEIVVLNEMEELLPKPVKKVINIHHKRPTFKDFFNEINKRTSENDINILTNTDIFLDKSINNLKSFPLDNKVLCLLRWENNNGNPQIEILRHDCQDTWIWKGKMKELDNTDFYLGKLGCDNRIAWEFENAGYKLENPCNLIKTIHLHNTQKRNYKQTLVGQPGHNTNKDVIPPPYAYIAPIF